MTAKQIVRLLLADGWSAVRQRGSHQAFKHPTKAGTIVVPMHTGDLAFGTERSILKQAGLL